MSRRGKQFSAAVVGTDLIHRLSTAQFLGRFAHVSFDSNNNTPLANLFV
jgi:hypothetical protein